jgi:2-polyprenyl-3-methyl-5-hydroxy-6-metoxy-1,4-benzoquinol methylase
MNEQSVDNAVFADELFAWELAENYFNFRNRSGASYSKKYETWKRTKNIIRGVFKEVRKKVRRAAIADIGCQTGRNIFLLNFLLSDEAQVTFRGIDSDAGAIAVARRANQVIGAATISFDCADALSGGLPAAAYDIVLCTEVIEHFSDPCGLLNELKRIVAPGGAIIVTTPNATNSVLFFKALHTRANTRAGCYGDERDNHVSVKGIKEWRRMFMDNGFRIEEIRRGALVCGGGAVDRHPVLFSASIVLDTMCDHLPFVLNVGENLMFMLRVKE